MPVKEKFFHTACCFIWIFGVIFDNFKFPIKNWCKKVTLAQESKIDARKLKISARKYFWRQNLKQKKHASERNYVLWSRTQPVARTQTHF